MTIKLFRRYLMIGHQIWNLDDWSSNLESSVTDRTLRIREICQADDMNSADKEFIIQALRWPIEEDRYLFTSEFCKVASNVEFIRLLKDNGFLDFFLIKTDE